MFLYDHFSSYFRNGIERNTPLHYATRLDNVEVVSVLVHSGATLDVKNKSGETPLDIAMSQGLAHICTIIKLSRIINDSDSSDIRSNLQSTIRDIEYKYKQEKISHEGGLCAFMKKIFDKHLVS